MTRLETLMRKPKAILELENPSFGEAFLAVHYDTRLIRDMAKDAKFRPYLRRLCRELAKKHSEELLYIDSVIWNTEEIARVAIKNDPKAILHFEESIQKKFAVEAVSRSPWILPHLAYKDEEVYRAAVKADGRFLNSVPEELKTLEMCALACFKDIWNLAYVPEKYRDEVLELYILQQENSYD